MTSLSLMDAIPPQGARWGDGVGGTRWELKLRKSDLMRESKSSQTWSDVAPSRNRKQWDNKYLDISLLLVCVLSLLFSIWSSPRGSQRARD